MHERHDRVAYARGELVLGIPRTDAVAGAGAVGLQPAFHAAALPCRRQRPAHCGLHDQVFQPSFMEARPYATQGHAKVAPNEGCA
jgi:hypothetical protein